MTPFCSAGAGVLRIAALDTPVMGEEVVEECAAIAAVDIDTVLGAEE